MKLFGKKNKKSLDNTMPLEKNDAFVREKARLEEQIKKVIIILETDKLKKNPEDGMLQLLYKRYSDAQKFLAEDKLDKIWIKGGGRAYLDAFSDYRCLLVEELGKAESLLENCKKIQESNLSNK